MSGPAGAGRLPRVAIVGRPNVGKSTLVNRFASRRRSIVGPTEGLTRDRVTTNVVWRGKQFEITDTGGLLEAALGDRAEGTITSKVAAHALKAIENADSVVFIVDVTTGVTAEDQALAKRLLKIDAPVIVAANKADDASGESLASEFWNLGLGEPMPVSALHGRGSGELLDRVVDLLPEIDEKDQPEPSIAIVGRPNVGKSSILNALVGGERAIVHDQPGTTRDSIDSIVQIDGRSYRFIDTAGLKRRAKTTGVDVAATSRTRQAVSRSDLAIIVIDASEGATSQDQRIAEAVAEAGVGALLALNKWDLLTDEDEAENTEEGVKDRLRFLAHAPIVRTSALTGRGIRKLARHLDEILEARSKRVPTSQVNRLVQEAQQQSPPPRAKNRNIHVRYASQVGVAPPKFVLFSDGPLAESWLRFVERRLRERVGFSGNPIKFVIRQKKSERRQARETVHE